MHRIFYNLFKRLPIGWLQLRKNKNRLLAAIAGVVFANILILMQLGFYSALANTVALPYNLFKADLIASANNSNTLTDGGYIPRVRLYQILSSPYVLAAEPLYISKVDWQSNNNDMINLEIFGISLNKNFINNADVERQLSDLSLLDSGLIDKLTRGLKKFDFMSLNVFNPKQIEINGKQVNLIGSFKGGGGFSADGYFIVSNQTFFNLIANSSSSTPKHILIQLKNSYLIKEAIQDIQKKVGNSDTIIRSYKNAIKADQSYQTTKRPIGIIFGFGVFIGILVGMIIIYQVLTSDVIDHLSEYATFKAIGYDASFFRSIIIEEACIFATLGFIPGSIISSLLYTIVGNFTGLPLKMTISRLFFVYIGTILMCSISGLLATRKVASADPANLF